MIIMPFDAIAIFEGIHHLHLHTVYINISNYISKKRAKRAKRERERELVQKAVDTIIE